jgi:outer membrane receptor protein involved in Fe transport
MSRTCFHKALFAGVSLVGLLSAPQVFAQQAAPAAGEATGLEQVVVTATRQTSTVNRVPLSIAAVTQQGLDQQGIKGAADISRLVPGLSIPPNGAGGQTAGATGVGIFTIRGVYSSAGAASTGVYMDDTSLTRRNNAGVFQENGAPLPVLFDLERVEVLKGPQGTLYGGSSQGGTVRFITPTPSLTTYSGSARLEGKTVKMGGNGGEVGFAVGGPLIQDKLGIRISAMARKNPGYIDAYSPYTGQKMFDNVNATTQSMVRGSLLWQATDRASVQLSGYASRDTTHSQFVAPSTIFSKSADGTIASPTETFTTPQRCFNNSVFATFVPYQPSLPFGTAPSATAVKPTEIACNSPITTKFVRPAVTYGPFKQGRDIAYMVNQQELSGRYTNLNVFSATLNYDFENMTVKSITSYVRDKTYAENAGGEDQTQNQYVVGGPVPRDLSGNPIVPANGIANNLVGFSLWGVFPDYPGHFQGQSKRSGIEEELRFSSKADAKPFNWVAGLFYSNQRLTNHYGYPNDHFDQSLLGFYGVNVQQRYGVSITSANNATELFAHLTDNDLAAYGEANYYITDKLKLTGGVRFSRLNFKFDSFDAGPFSSRYPNSFGGSSAGSVNASPTTPKIGLTYEFTQNDLVYVNASKGFRSGGVNAPVGQVVCQPGLDLYGIKATDAPLTYGPDTVWNYEAGGKFRLLDNKLQLNGAAYRIDWTGIQSAITLTCGQGFVLNGGKARSEGFDFQGQYRPIQPLTVSLNVGYDNAYYVDPVAGPRGPGIGPPAVNAGDHFPVPKWQVSASINYVAQITSTLDSYLQLDYQWQSGYVQPGSFGVAAYSPFTLRVAGTDVVNARLGFRFDKVDLNVFANNLLDGNDKIGNAGIGKTQCNALDRSCTAYNNFNPFVNQLYQRPREIGVQANYRF